MLDRLLRVENLVVIPLILVAVLVGLGARWRDDPERAGLARAIAVSVRVGLIVLFVLIGLFVALVLAAGPIGP